MKVRSAIIFVLLLAALVSPTLAQDPDRPDSLIIGHFDGTPIIASPGQEIAIPIWWKSDDSVYFFHIPVASDDERVATRDGGLLYHPFDDLDSVTFLSPESGSPYQGYTNQSLAGFTYQNDGGGDPRHARCPEDILWYIWIYMGDFILTSRADTTSFGQATELTEGRNAEYGGLQFVLYDLERMFEPTATWGSIHFTDFFSGDVNHSYAINGLDVIFLVNYLKGYGPAPEPYLSGDANGNCVVNGMDVVYLVNYLKGIGPAPIAGQCP